MLGKTGTLPLARKERRKEGAIPSYPSRQDRGTKLGRTQAVDTPAELRKTVKYLK